MNDEKKIALKMVKRYMTPDRSYAISISDFEVLWGMNKAKSLLMKDHIVGHVVQNLRQIGVMTKGKEYTISVH